MADPPSNQGDGVEPDASGGSSAGKPGDVEPPTFYDPSLLYRQDVPDYPAIAHYGRFELLGRIALGGMAEIFLARDHDDAGSVRHLVIKRVLPHVADDDDFIRMFLDEAQIANRLYHPNVCHTYESGEIDGSYFMAMEWVHGVPLRKVIRRANAANGIPLPIGVKIIALVAEGLHYAHNAPDKSGEPLDIVHRDVSPHNVMVGFEGEVKLLDFGIAKAALQATETQAGIIKGKYAYLSPEQCQSDKVDARSDVFALGICLYETLTGRPLYHRDSVLDTMTAIVREGVPSARTAVPNLPEQLDTIIRTALQKRPEHRYRSAAQMRDALEGYLEACGEVVADKRIADFLETLFDEEERHPLSGANVGTESGREGSQSLGAPVPESGSFGPFGQSSHREGEPQAEVVLGDPARPESADRPTWPAAPGATATGRQASPHADTDSSAMQDSGAATSRRGWYVAVLIVALAALAAGVMASL